jgi:hypothetical protein
MRVSVVAGRASGCTRRSRVTGACAYGAYDMSVAEKYAIT